MMNNSVTIIPPTRMLGSGPPSRPSYRNRLNDRLKLEVREGQLWYGNVQITERGCPGDPDTQKPYNKGTYGWYRGSWVAIAPYFLEDKLPVKLPRWWLTQWIHRCDDCEGWFASRYSAWLCGECARRRLKDSRARHDKTRKRIRAREHQDDELICGHCGGPCDHHRRSRQFCSNACRQAAYRTRAYRGRLQEEATDEWGRSLAVMAMAFEVVQ